MKNIDVLSALYVGIDISARTNVVYAMDFNSKCHLKFSVPNDRGGATLMASKFYEFLSSHAFKHLIIALESTSLYGVHIANFLSSCEELMPFDPYVYCLNPKMISNYKKSFIGLSKTDPIDAFVIADFARVGRITTKPWRGSQFMALQRLTRHRLHLIDLLVREKTYMSSNVYLKFNKFATPDKGEEPFSNPHGVTASAILTEFLSPEDIASMPIEDLVCFIQTKGKNRFVDPSKTATLLQEAARNSYRLDKCLYEPITISIASSYSCILAIEKEVKVIEKAINKLIQGLNTTEYQSLTSIPGIGPVFAAGILAEIGSITSFRSQDALAKYAGLTWNRTQSGSFEADNTRLTKAGNSFLRYYLIEAAFSVSRLSPEYKTYYQKKYAEVTKHQHKRALALTARKLVRLIFGLLANHQLYSAKRAEDNNNS